MHLAREEAKEAGLGLDPAAPTFPSEKFRKPGGRG